MNIQIYDFTLGDFHCHVINDGFVNTIPAKDFFDGAGPDALQEAFEQHAIPDGNLQLACNVLVVDTGKEIILIDTGCGLFYPAGGHLLEGLRLLDIQPEDVDIVFLSHGHWDHINGSVNKNNQPMFPNARYMMTAGEYQHWTANAQPESIGPLTAIQNQLVLINPHKEIVKGVQAVFMPGHTLYHTGLKITSGDESLLCIIDIMDHPIHLEHPNWQPTWEMLANQSLITRQRIIKRAYKENTLVHAYHFPFPGLGHIEKVNTAWQWIPIEQVKEG